MSPSVTIIASGGEHLGTVLLMHGYSGHKEPLKLLAYAIAPTGLISALIDLLGRGGEWGFMEAGAINPRISQFEESILKTIEFLRDRGYNLSKINPIGRARVVP